MSREKENAMENLAEACGELTNSIIAARKLGATHLEIAILVSHELDYSDHGAPITRERIRSSWCPHAYRDDA